MSARCGVRIDYWSCPNDAAGASDSGVNLCTTHDGFMGYRIAQPPVAPPRRCACPDDQIVGTTPNCRYCREDAEV